MNALNQLVLGMLCVGVCAGVCAGQAETPVGASANETKNIVQGKVVQDPDGQGIRKVKVSFRDRSQYEAITDETGQFKVEGMEPGVYMVQLERSGYATDAKTNQHKTVQVVAGHDTKDLVFHMLAAGVITGKIVDTEGDPLQNVSMVAISAARGATKGNWGRQGIGVTNDLGEYRIADLAPGKYIVQGTPPENQAPPPGPNKKDTTEERLVYVATYFPGTLDEQQAAVVEVSARGTATANFGVRTSHAYRVSGTVLGMGGQSMGEVVLVGKNGRGGHQQQLGEGGRFEFPNVLPGTYLAHLIVFSGFANGQPSLKMQRIRTSIEVNGSDVVGLQLQIDRGGDVSGKLRAEGNEKIDWKELSVSLRTVPEGEEEGVDLGTEMPAGMAQVNEDGSFEIKDVPGANYQLAVMAHSERFRDYYTKSVLLSGQEVVDTGFYVTPGMALDVMVSAKGAGIEGTVVDGEGKLVPGATVLVVPSSGKLGRTDAYQFDRSDEKGHFMLRGMNPGKFLVLAFEEMQGNYRAPDFAKKYEGKGEKVELEEGGKKSVVLKLITEESKGP